MVNLFSRYRSLGKNGQDVLWNFASFVIMGVCGVLINFIIAGFYNPEVLGVYNQVYAVYIVSSQFAVVGIHLSVLKYVAQYVHEKERTRAIVSSALLLSASFALLSCLILWIGRWLIAAWMESPAVGNGLAWALPGLFFFSLNKVILSVLNGQSRMKLYAVFQALRYILMIAVIVLVAWSGLPGENLSMVFTVAELVLLLGLLPAIWPSLGFPGWQELRSWMRLHFDFGMRGFLSNVLLGLNPRVDVLILGYFSSDFTVGVFSLAASAAEGLYQLPVVLRTNLNPILVRQISEGRMDELRALARRSMRWTYLSILGVGLLAVLVYPLGLNLVANQEKFIQSWPIFAILVVGIVAASGYIPFSNILLLAGRPGAHTLMISLQVFFNIAGNLLLVPYWGGYGAAIATSLAYVFLVVLVKVFARKMMRLSI